MIEFLHSYVILNTDSLDRLAPHNTVPTSCRSSDARRHTIRVVPLHSQRRPIADGGGLAWPLAGDRVTAYSGRSEPANQINPAAVQAIGEVEITIDRCSNANTSPIAASREVTRPSRR
jgi:hypothetical protein